jgi:hypothetical protein
MNWNKKHDENWKTQLELNSEGFSNFQVVLIEKVKETLNLNSISFSEEISIHNDLNNYDREVKMITLNLNDFSESKIWIYHDMAEYEINKIHHVYEEHGYLTPEELQEEFLKSMSEIIEAN